MGGWFFYLIVVVVGIVGGAVTTIGENLPKVLALPFLLMIPGGLAVAWGGYLESKNTKTKEVGVSALLLVVGEISFIWAFVGFWLTLLPGIFLSGFIPGLCTPSLPTDPSLWALGRQGSCQEVITYVKFLGWGDLAFVVIGTTVTLLALILQRVKTE